jgi:phage shock protein A
MLKEPVQEALRGDIQALNEAVETHQDQVTNLLEYISRLKAELAVKEETIESITAGMNGLGVTEGAADHPEHADTADEPDRSVEPMDI